VRPVVRTVSDQVVTEEQTTARERAETVADVVEIPLEAMLAVA
jgi:purine-nucleoside phosphorylase